LQNASRASFRDDATGCKSPDYFRNFKRMLASDSIAWLGARISPAGMVNEMSMAGADAREVGSAGDSAGQTIGKESFTP
jgi:hypothetical protein